MGLCYTTLNQEIKYTQNISGVIGGYRVIFSTNLHEYMEYDPNVVSTISLAEAGIQVSLSNFDLTSTVAANTHVIRIAPSTAASVALSVTKIDHTEKYLQDWPWASVLPTCVLESGYRALNECLPDQILYYLGDNKAVQQCLHHNLKMFDLKMRDSVIQMCYTTTITQQLSYTSLIMDTLRELQTLSSLTNVTFSMVNIYYSQLGYTEYYERYPTFSSWFSDLGGQMGLFLGASFITLVELLFTVCYVVRLVVYKGTRAVYLKAKCCFTRFRDTNPST
ncbi:Degenerin del-1-like [Homarus americanus]|uniref:Degenerin del-1-like n=1 Tax=Homarus americanus TaxID=6706 RepID=A0A8J5JG46_HOMAM|nr:Degenerin del-1-like [Homarus americanus]